MTTPADNWNDLPVTIVGMGRSAAGAARLLKKHGARPFVSDASDNASLAPWIADLDSQAIPYEVGGHTDRAWSSPALVVLSPGVPPAIPPLTAMRARGVEIIGELELASRFAQASLLAVTGTNGKTTVTELLQHLITACGYRSHLAGNNHTSFSAALCDDDAPDYYVLEVSSYQLESVTSFAPWIGAVLNVTPDHLGRHGSMEKYAADKARVFGGAQRCSSFGVLNADDEIVDGMSTPRGTERIQFSLAGPVARGLHIEGDTLWIDGEAHGPILFPLPGPHNRANTLAALAMMQVGGFDLACCLRALPDFTGVEHRLEALGESGGCLWYNDSKSTNVDSLRVALESFDVPLILIAGGQGKGSSYDTLVPLIRARVAHLIAYGAEGPTLAAAFDGIVPLTVVTAMDEAVEMAHSSCTPGGTVLLSPGCASFDQYSDFEARGAHFKGLVAALNPGKAFR